jgi:imidazolonepropionase
VIAIVNVGQLVTLAGPPRARVHSEMRELSIISGGAMLIRDGKIERVGTQQEIEPHIGKEHQIIDAKGRAVLPGFVDAHTHPVFAATRVDEYELRAGGATYEEIAAAGGGIRSSVRTTRAAPEEELFETARRRVQWFLRTGTTTIEAKSGYGLSLEAELKMLRVIHRLGNEGFLRIVPTFLGAHEIPDEYRGDTNGYIDLLIHEMLPRVSELKLAEYCDIFCEPRVFNVSSARRYLQAAKDLHFGLRIHADQLELSGAGELAA